ncbi:hypothetical protein ADS79_10840 [Brevibacillus reuszeri]|uniref:Uncharacterized protein n=1 Tax=Brevibacillus reuszeri TaxID=54915 RepID=A0A0K9YUJ3_9BACL|nr:hypothetical protein ADS79_10840 [Brevibacillus reuszeri]
MKREVGENPARSRHCETAFVYAVSQETCLFVFAPAPSRKGTASSGVPLDVVQPEQPAPLRRKKSHRGFLVGIERKISK